MSTGIRCHRLRGAPGESVRTLQIPILIWEFQSLYPDLSCQFVSSGLLERCWRGVILARLDGLAYTSRLSRSTQMESAWPSTRGHSIFRTSSTSSFVRHHFSPHSSFAPALFNVFNSFFKYLWKMITIWALPQQTIYEETRSRFPPSTMRT